MTFHNMLPELTQKLLAAITETCEVNEQKSAMLAQLERERSYQCWTDLQLAHALLCSRASTREIETSLDSLAFALTVEGGSHSALETAIAAMEDALAVQHRFMALLVQEIEARCNNV
jgi:hypothetical protein